jgi:hypothetical protein
LSYNTGIAIRLRIGTGAAEAACVGVGHRKTAPAETGRSGLEDIRTESLNYDFFAGAFLVFLTGHLCVLVALQVFLVAFFGAAFFGAAFAGAVAAGAVVVVEAAGAAVVVAAALPRAGIAKARATPRPRAERMDFFMASFSFSCRSK